MVRPVQNALAYAGQIGRIADQQGQIRQNQRGRGDHAGARLEIQGVPTLVFFKGGKVVDSLVGLPSSDTLKMRVESLAKMDAAAAVN